MENRDSGRKGKAVEHLVAATCILISGMELNVSTSLVDDEGVDLVFHRRDVPTTLAVQVKSRSMGTVTISERDRFLANVGASTFRPRDDLFVLFVAVDTSEGTFGPAWFVPSIDFADRAKVNSKGQYRFSASTKPESKDQWSAFKVTRSELPQRILDEIDALSV